MMESTARPQEIRRGSSGLQIKWSDSKLSSIPYANLRQACSCAVCREFKRPPQFAEPRFVKSRTIYAMDAVGNYALGITWEDSHRSIYAFDRLREIPETPPSEEAVQKITLTQEDIEAALSNQNKKGCGNGGCGCKNGK